MNKKLALYAISALALIASSYTYPEFSFNWFGEPVVTIDSCAPLTSAITRTTKRAAVATALWTGYAVKQWWNVSQLLNQVEQCCKIDRHDYRKNSSNPFWAIQSANGQLFDVDTIRDPRLPETHKINQFIRVYNLSVKGALDKVDRLMGQLERHTPIRQKINQFAEERQIVLSEQLTQEQINTLTTEVERWLEQSMNSGLDWRWNGFQASWSRYLWNTGHLLGRITRILYQPQNKTAAQAYLKLWNIRERLIALEQISERRK